MKDIDRVRLTGQLERLQRYTRVAVTVIASADTRAVDGWMESMAHLSDDELRATLKREARSACQLATRLRGLAGAYAVKKRRRRRQ